MWDVNAEHVVPIDLGLTWCPGAPEPWLFHHRSTAALVLNEREPRVRPFVVEWEGCGGAVLGPPNEDVGHGHRLWKRGLEHCLWTGEVINSSWLAELDSVQSVHPTWQEQAGRRSRVPPAERIRHFIFPMKDETFEVVARGCKIHYPESDPIAFALNLVAG